MARFYAERNISSIVIRVQTASLKIVLGELGEILCKFLIRFSKTRRLDCLYAKTVVKCVQFSFCLLQRKLRPVRCMPR